MIILGLVGFFLAGIDLAKYMETREPKWLAYMVIALGTGAFMIYSGIVA